MDTKSEATKHRMSGIGRNPPPSPPEQEHLGQVI